MSAAVYITLLLQKKCSTVQTSGYTAIAPTFGHEGNGISNVARLGVFILFLKCRFPAPPDLFASFQQTIATDHPDFNPIVSFSHKTQEASCSLAPLLASPRLRFIWFSCVRASATLCHHCLPCFELRSGSGEGLEVIGELTLCVARLTGKISANGGGELKLAAWRNCRKFKNKHQAGRKNAAEAATSTYPPEPNSLFWLPAANINHTSFGYKICHAAPGAESPLQTVATERMPLVPSTVPFS